MKKYLFIVSIIVCSISIQAQTPDKNVTKANYELASRFSPVKIRKMVFSTRVSPNWLKTSGRFWYVYSTPNSKRWVIVDPAKRTKSDLFDDADLAAKLSVITQDPQESQHLELNDLKFSDDEKTIRFQVDSKKEIAISQKERKNLKNKSDTLKKKTFYLEYNLATTQLIELPDTLLPKKDLSWASFSPDTSVIVLPKAIIYIGWTGRIIERHRKMKKIRLL